MPALSEMSESAPHGFESVVRVPRSIFADIVREPVSGVVGA